MFCINIKVFVKVVKFNLLGWGSEAKGQSWMGGFNFRCSLILLPFVNPIIVILKEKYSL